MGEFEKQLKDHIHLNGPVSVATFMEMALRHYYSTRDPFGADGDFTTAPEISQMFGEMIAIFMADCWVKMKGPGQCALVEIGPGRGTLMADMLRALKKVPEFYESLSVHLIEMSPVLKEKQQKALRDYEAEWHRTLETVPRDRVLFLIGNEFLDALPVRQFQFQDGEWHERVVGLENDRLVFGVSGRSFNLASLAESKDRVVEGAVFERSEARELFVREVSERLKAQGGVALFIDYGHDQSGTGDTLQAVKAHQYVDVLSDAGEADLTAHVDFGVLAETIGKGVHGPVSQAAFLKHIGIEIRAEKLQQKEELKRLTGSDQMGELFRVMAICHDEGVQLAGFA